MGYDIEDIINNESPDCVGIISRLREDIAYIEKLKPVYIKAMSSHEISLMNNYVLHAEDFLYFLHYNAVPHHSSLTRIAKFKPVIERLVKSGQLTEAYLGLFS